MFRASVRIFLAEAFFFIIIMNADKDFINIFNEFYPFERYIVRTPKSIEPVFDDLILTEIFVPKTEIKPIIHNDKLVGFTGVEYDEIYVKVRGVAGEIRIGYFDFASHIREAIRNIVITDFGHYEWQSLYVQDEDEELPELEKVLSEQKALIEKKYKECVIKDDTPNIRFVHV